MGGALDPIEKFSLRGGGQNPHHHPGGSDRAWGSLGSAKESLILGGKDHEPEARSATRKSQAKRAPHSPFGDNEVWGEVSQGKASVDAGNRCREKKNATHRERREGQGSYHT